MSIYAEINRNPSRSELVKFGLIVLVGMGALGAVMEYRQENHTAAMGFWIAGGAVMLLSLIPPIGRILYILWMGFGLTIGLFTSPIVMGVVYLLVIVPVALIFKITKRDLMRRELDPKAASYWEDYPKDNDPGSYIRQF
jgi:hypothetical protein